MLGHIRQVRVGGHRDLFDVLLTIPNEAEVGDHRAERKNVETALMSYRHEQLER